ncbi:hypothetical protein LXT21_20195 [Myxococcus sp. K38C18041901]|uniref:hypothetical protein n=1 Tax=Myxococcus guangdongensis TaxID=2906760 RepID=UPI0020A7EA11|nr:hypothetical protein [Myxococcus guangdongensis]MCP3061105.1 hypothetical protein [Myxococcus guangdongensis]
MTTAWIPRAALLCSCLLLLGGCSPERDTPSEAPLGETTQALTNSISTYTNPSLTPVLSSAGGRQTVWDPAGLHTVWTHAGIVYYATSRDGAIWTPPMAVDSNAALAPSITLYGNGNVGIVYLRAGAGGPGNHHVYYRSRSRTGVWSAPFKVTSDYTSEYVQSTSIDGLGDLVYLAWSSKNYINYLSFPGAQASPLATSYTINLSMMCSSYTLSHPAIAVALNDVGALPNPIIRIAWYQYGKPYFPTGCTSGYSFGWKLAQKPEDQNDYWPVIASTAGEILSTTTTTPVSLSLTANKTTGDYYLATSEVVDGVGSTWLGFENARNPSDTWRWVSLLPRASLVDVAAEFTSCGPQFRVAHSDVTVSADGYSPSFSRTGTWEGAATTPTWIDSHALMSAQGRVGDAVIWQTPVDAANVRDVSAVFEGRAASPFFSLMSFHDTKPNPNCGPPSCTACHAMGVAPSKALPSRACPRSQP